MKRIVLIAILLLFTVPVGVFALGQEDRCRDYAKEVSGYDERATLSELGSRTFYRGAFPGDHNMGMRHFDRKNKLKGDYAYYQKIYGDCMNSPIDSPDSEEEFVIY